MLKLLRVESEMVKAIAGSEPGTLLKGLKILQVLGDNPRGVRFSELAETAELANSTAHRILGLLVDRGFVEYDQQSRLYTLGLKLLELSQKVNAIVGVAEVARPVMRDLADRSGMLVSLDVLDGVNIVVVERVDPPTRIRIGGELGMRQPIHSTSAGKSMLATLPASERKTLLAGLVLTRQTRNTLVDPAAFTAEIAEAERRGFAIGNEENEEGVRSIAVAIPTRQGRRRAALSLAAPSFLTDGETMIKHLPALQAAAKDISARLGSL
ncbi:IclR family transcriptional regulator [Mesorhizobium sp. M0955]|uniref:IclR family transcriptional regulator n=1 Tax=Mesorhizobium sp. M0955 TaxID=2957033 RepID=UPI00333B7976